VPVETPNGTGTLKIKPGTANGSVQRLRGQGVCAIGRHPAGDLHIVLIAETPQSLTKDQIKLLEQLRAEESDKTYPTRTKQNKAAKAFAERRGKKA
jgi:molecular chaperone DnaJ